MPRGAIREISRPMKEHRPKVVSLMAWLVARAKRRGEPVAPIIRRAVLAALDEAVAGLGVRD